MINEIISPSSVYDKIYQNILEPAHRQISRLAAQETGADENSPQVLILTHTLFGQAVMFRIHKEALLRRMKIKQYTPELLNEIKKHIGGKLRRHIGTGKEAKMKKIPTILIAAAAAVAAFFLLTAGKKDDDGVITLYGNVDIRQVDMSFRVPGTLKEMFFEEGERVQKGDLLAALDDEDYRRTYEKSLAEIKRCEAQLREAVSLLETNLPLCKQKISSERSCISYANARDEAAAAVEAAKSAGRYEKNQLEYTKIYAPADGIVSSRIQEPGATVSAGQPVYTVTKTEPLWIRVYLPEPKLGRVDYGSKAVIVTDGIDPATGERKHYRGHVGYISPVAEFTPKTVQTEELRTDLVYRLNIYVDDADRFLKQGMPTTVKIYAEHEEKSDDGEKLH